MRRLVSATLSGLKYLIAVLMILSGINTMFFDEPVDVSRLGFIYENRWTLFAFGVFFFISGMTLLVAKIKKMRRIVGYSLMTIYLTFLFVSILNWYAFGVGQAVGNIIGAVVVGGLYLRWKYHIYYYEPSVDRIHERMVEFYSHDEDPD